MELVKLPAIVPFNFYIYYRTVVSKIYLLKNNTNMDSDMDTDLNLVLATPQNMHEFPQPPVCSFSSPEKVPCVISWIIYLVFVLATVAHLIWFYRNFQLRKRERDEQPTNRPPASGE